jgi:hypothetical protein
VTLHPTRRRTARGCRNALFCRLCICMCVCVCVCRSVAFVCVLCFGFCGRGGVGVVVMASFLACLLLPPAWLTLKPNPSSTTPPHGASHAPKHRLRRPARAPPLLLPLVVLPVLLLLAPTTRTRTRSTGAATISSSSSGVAAPLPLEKEEEDDNPWYRPQSEEEAEDELGAVLLSAGGRSSVVCVCVCVCVYVWMDGEPPTMFPHTSTHPPTHILHHTHHGVRQDGGQQVHGDKRHPLQRKHQRHRAITAPDAAPPLLPPRPLPAGDGSVGRDGGCEGVNAPGADAQEEAGERELCVDGGGEDEGAPEGAGHLCVCCCVLLIGGGGGGGGGVCVCVGVEEGGSVGYVVS